MKPIAKQRMAWALTGSGHYLRECIDILNTLEDVDLFLSKAAAEILQQYNDILDDIPWIDLYPLAYAFV